jgi:hypothetical protein
MEALLRSSGFSHMSREDSSPFALPVPLPAGTAPLRMDLVVFNAGSLRTGDLTLDGTSLLLDVSIVDPAGSANLTEAARSSGHAAQKQATEKHYHYRHTFDAASYTLLPVVFETHGRLGVEATKLLRAAAVHAVGGPEAAGDKARLGRQLHQMRQQLSVALTAAVSRQRLFHTRWATAPGAGGAGAAPGTAGPDATPPLPALVGISSGTRLFRLRPFLGRRQLCSDAALVLTNIPPKPPTQTKERDKT